MQSFPNEILKTIKEHFEEEKTKLQERLKALEEQDPFANPERTNDNAASDMEASEEADHDRVVAVTAELKEKLVTIDAALKRIEEGTYGACEECGQMIDTDRLSILPMATLCLSCEQKKKK